MKIRCSRDPTRMPKLIKKPQKVSQKWHSKPTVRNHSQKYHFWIPWTLENSAPAWAGVNFSLFRDSRKVTKKASKIGTNKCAYFLLDVGSILAPIWTPKMDQRRTKIASEITLIFEWISMPLLHHIWCPSGFQNPGFSLTFWGPPPRTPPGTPNGPQRKPKGTNNGSKGRSKGFKMK